MEDWNEQSCNIYGGHLARLKKQEILRDILEENLHRPRRARRTRLRWVDGGEADARSVAQIRTGRHRTEPNGGSLSRKPRTTPGCITTNICMYLAHEVS